MTQIPGWIEQHFPENWIEIKYKIQKTQMLSMWTGKILCDIGNETPRDWDVKLTFLQGFNSPRLVAQAISRSIGITWNCFRKVFYPNWNHHLALGSGSICISNWVSSGSRSLREFTVKRVWKRKNILTGHWVAVNYKAQYKDSGISNFHRRGWDGSNAECSVGNKLIHCSNI